ncbi:MAG TPA: EAL domain-containing protein [Polyangiaceae bacterium]|jgi:EAL domain-containing protein (putative c-di-GMP-specific phosphodiesterase class I)|nr:EAL domain-containing protein [Polyangiaceae bacterium]
MRWTTTGLIAAESNSVRVVRETDVDVVFQPIVDVKTGQTFAHEALARCKLPRFHSPIALFEQAEREEACGRLGRVVRNVLFEQCARKRVFINVHPQEVSQRWLVQPTDPLFMHDSDVFIEVTEAAAFEYFDVCMSVLSELRARCDAKIVVDDFGAGHSDFHRVLSLQPDMVKLDMSLVRDLHLDLERQVHVRHIIDTCHELGAKVVAEGVETQEELDVSVALGTDFVQGYLLGRPSSPPVPGVWPGSPSLMPRSG